MVLTMSKFSELFNKPLPSKEFLESTEEPDTTNIDPETDVANETGADKLLNEMDNLFNKDATPAVDPEPVAPQAATPMPEQLTSPGISDFDDFKVDTPDNADVVPNAQPLSPEQDQRVDDIMNIAGTQALLQSELTESEIIEFVESIDSDVVVAEGFLTEKTIVKFDKNAKKAQLYEIAVAAVAKEHNDPLFKKLTTVYKMERILKAKLRKKYHAEATKKVKEYLARAKKSKSNVLSRIVNKITGKK